MDGSGGRRGQVQRSKEAHCNRNAPFLSLGIEGSYPVVDPCRPVINSDHDAAADQLLQALRSHRRILLSVGLELWLVARWNLHSAATDSQTKLSSDAN